MAEVVQLFTIARRLFAPESIPWSQLTTPSNLSRLEQKYKFAQLVQPQMLQGGATQLQVIGANGEYRHGGSLIGIQNLSIEPNVIQLQVSAETQKADLFFADLAAFLEELRSASRIKLDEYKKSYQTVAVVKLRVSYDKIFSPNMGDYLTESVMPRLKLPDGDPHIRLAALSWVVTYRTESTDAAYLPKVLTIEPRAGSKIEDRIYYTISPTDSQTHIGLLEEFERKLGEGVRASSAKKPGAHRLLAKKRST
jgi:hypothetical protein